MAFELIAPEINKIINRKLLTDVTIHRYLYQHSRATVVIDWDEELREGNKKTDQQTTRVGASALDSDVQLIWKGKELDQNVECFRGYVERVSSRHDGKRSYLILDCVSYSQQTDLIPRYRVWQDCTLLDVCQHIAGKEKLIEISSDAQSTLSGNTLELSVQYGETDFAYLRRMLHAWGIPLAVDDRIGKVIIGQPKASGKGAFPESSWRWAKMSIEGSLAPVNQARSAGHGPIGIAKTYGGRFVEKLDRTAADYFPRMDDDAMADYEWINERLNDNAFHHRSATLHLCWEEGVFDQSPGCVVSVDGQPYMVRAVIIAGHPTMDTVTQEFVLQDHMAPLHPHERRVVWSSRMVWAKVTKNDHSDPQQAGRLQVEFDWEALDKTGSNKCWLPYLTPYAGLKGKGTAGFICLPEVGERVLVQFLDEWDSNAVIVGSAREHPRQGYIYDPDKTKRWRTPSGNEISMTTEGADDDIIRVKCKDKMVFEAKISGGKETIIFDLMDSDSDRIHFQKGGGPTRLDVDCSGEIFMRAAQKMYITAAQIQLEATAGNVNIKGMTVDIDGASGVNIDGAMVKLNCPPAIPHWKLQPLKKDPDKAKEKSPDKPKKRTRTKYGASASGAAAAQQAQEKQVKDFIEIELVDDQGNPCPNERYELKLPDGSIRSGRLDANGRARMDGIEPGTAQVRYPDIPGSQWSTK